jgi:hypothetical protein
MPKKLVRGKIVDGEEIPVIKETDFHNLADGRSRIPIVSVHSKKIYTIDTPEGIYKATMDYSSLKPGDEVELLMTKKYILFDENWLIHQGRKYPVTSLEFC